MKQAIKTDKAPAPIGPYNQAIMTGNTLYVSGQVPINPATGKLEKDDVKHQTKLVMEHIKSILEEAEMNFSHIIKCSIFISDMANFPQINEVYGSYFDETPPARETIAVKGLPLGADVEISCIAVK